MIDETTPPPEPTAPLGMPGDRRGPSHWPRKRVFHAIKEAILRGPSRRNDQVMFWTVRTVIEATKTLGFPIVVSFLLLFGGYKFGNAFIDAQKTALATQQSLLVQNNTAAIAAQDRGTAAIHEMANALNESNEITRTLMVEVRIKTPKPPKKKIVPPVAP